MKETNNRKDSKSIDLVKRSTSGIFSDESPSPVNKGNLIIFKYNLNFCESYTI